MESSELRPMMLTDALEPLLSKVAN